MACRKFTRLSLLAFTILVVFVSSFSVNAETTRIKVDTPFIIGERENSMIEVETSHELSGRLVHVQKLIKLNKNISLPRYCFNLLEWRNVSARVYDLEVRMGDEVLRQEKVLDFVIRDNFTSEAELFCIGKLDTTDRVEIDYSIIGKINGVHKERNLSLFKKNLILAEERYYPFDKYLFESWSSLPPKLVVTHSAYVKVPSSFSFVENVSQFSCPSLTKKILVSVDNRTGEEIVTPILTMAFFSYEHSVCEECSNPSDELAYVDLREGRESLVKVFGEVTCSPGTPEVKSFARAMTNLTYEDFDSTRDGRTGHYLKTEIERPELIKALFIASIVAQITAGALIFIRDRSTKNSIENVILVSASIWGFQQGLNVLSPTVRPLMVTLFDLSILAMVPALTLLSIRAVYRKYFIREKRIITSKR